MTRIHWHKWCHLPKLLNAGCFSRLRAPRYQHFHFGVPEKCRYRYLGLQVTLPVTHKIVCISRAGSRRLYLILYSSVGYQCNNAGNF